MIKTTWDDIHSPNCERREYSGQNYRSSHGRNTIDIECPWCDRVATAYIWSLSGGGKRCECGALFGSGGSAFKLFAPPKDLRWCVVLGSIYSHGSISARIVAMARAQEGMSTESFHTAQERTGKIFRYICARDEFEWVYQGVTLDNEEEDRVRELIKKKGWVLEKFKAGVES